MNGRQAFVSQRTLAKHVSLDIPNRRGFSIGDPEYAECLEADADDLVERLGTGAHLVGASVGGVVALLAAGRRPEAVRSLVLIEPPALTFALDDPAVAELHRRFVAQFARAPSLADREFARGFYDAMDSDAPLPRPGPENDLALARLRFERPWELELPLEELRDLPFPKCVVSGGWHPGFEAAGDRLADVIGADRCVIEGRGHAVQFTGKPFNELLMKIWQSVA